MNSSKQLYRPYISETELRYLTALLKQDYIRAGTATAYNLINKLNALVVKIDNDLVKPVYTKKEKETIESELGFEPTIQESTKQSRTQRKLMLFTRVTHGELSLTDLTTSEINLYNEYMYENDLMSPQDEAAYEASIGNL